MNSRRRLVAECACHMAPTSDGSCCSGSVAGLEGETAPGVAPSRVGGSRQLHRTGRFSEAPLRRRSAARIRSAPPAKSSAAYQQSRPPQVRQHHLASALRPVRFKHAKTLCRSRALTRVEGAALRLLAGYGSASSRAGRTRNSPPSSPRHSTTTLQLGARSARSFRARSRCPSPGAPEKRAVSLVPNA